MADWWPTDGRQGSEANSSDTEKAELLYLPILGRQLIGAVSRISNELSMNCG